MTFERIAVAALGAWVGFFVGFLIVVLFFL